jgi:hypothetical protein
VARDVSEEKKGTPYESAQAPCKDCALLSGPDRGRGISPHGNLARMEGEHLSRHHYKCTTCGTVHGHNSLSGTWF